MRSRASEQGAIAPASLLAAAIVAIAIGAAGYAMTAGPSNEVEQQPAAQRVTPTPSPAKASSTPPAPEKTAPPVIDRTSFRVAVFNNSTVPGLAARTADKVSTAGWNVVTTAQWTASTLNTSTIYYPASMKAAAKLLGDDMGITTLKPTVAPAQPDQLTIILTASYSN